jgi:hypothetical protein
MTAFDLLNAKRKTQNANVPSLTRCRPRPDQSSPPDLYVDGFTNDSSAGPTTS